MKRTVYLLLLSVSILAEAQRRPSNIISPEVLSDNSVIFRIKAPNAECLFTRYQIMIKATKNIQ